MNFFNRRALRQNEAGLQPERRHSSRKTDPDQLLVAAFDAAQPVEGRQQEEGVRGHHRRHRQEHPLLEVKTMPISIVY